MNEKKISRYITAKYVSAMALIVLILIVEFIVQYNFLNDIDAYNRDREIYTRLLTRLSTLDDGLPVTGQLRSLYELAANPALANFGFQELSEAAGASQTEEFNKALDKAVSAAADSLNAFNARQQSTQQALQKTNLIIFVTLLLALHGVMILFLRPMRRKLSELYSTILDQRDEALTASRSKSEFLSAMGHEIRTSLNGVIGMTDLLLESHLVQEQQDNLKSVKKSGYNLVTIIENILDYVQIEAGRLELDRVFFSLRSMLDELIDRQRPAAEEKQLELVYIIEPDVPDTILGDEKRLRKVLEKLLDNALRYTRKGEVFLRVYRVQQAGDQCDIQFLLSDTGPGIPPERLRYIFKPFSRIAEKGEHRFGGSGLGMAIAGQLVTRMDGKIWLESEISRGTTVFVQIPFTVSEKAQQLYEQQKSHILKNKHVLIVDETAETRRMLSVQCHGWGMLPKSAGDCETVGMLLHQHVVDVVLIDEQLVQSCSGHFPADLPKIILAGENGSPGTANMLKKPVNQGRLYAMLLEIFSQSSGNNPQKEETRSLPLKILLADDNSINRKLISQLAARLGYNIDVALDGVQAVEMAGREKYDLIFMDVEMPELDGLSATRNILQTYSERGAAAPKIVAMTANAENQDKEMCFEAGMVDYISKPVDAQKLKETIAHWSSVINSQEKAPSGA